MKVVLEQNDDVQCVNWLAIAERIAEHARKQISDAMLRAGEELKQLAPGETRKYVIEIGTIEISREMEEEKAS